MPVELDSTPVTGNTGASGGELNLVHTCGAGDNRLVVLCISVVNDNGAAIDSVFYDFSGSAFPMEFAGSVEDTDDANTYIYFHKNPPANDASIDVRIFLTASVAADGDLIATVFQLRNVDLDAPFGSAFTSTAASNPSVTVTDAASDDLIVDCCSAEDDTTPTQGADQTLQGTDGGGIAGGACSTQPGSLGQVMSWSTAGSTHTAHVALAAKFSGGGGGGGAPEPRKVAYPYHQRMAA